MNGAESLVKTLVANGIEVCFSNPGTSEMHFVAALDGEPKLRAILCMFEGVCTGAADAYARIKGKPAATLLHLGGGLSNGSANLHNAKKARMPVVNIIGDHALRHQRYETPLRSDITALAKPVSDWVHTTYLAESISADVAKAIESAGQRNIATLILPADVSWSDNANEQIMRAKARHPAAASKEALGAALQALQNGKKTLLLVDGRISVEMSLQLSQIAQMTGANVCCESFPTCLSRGAGSGQIDRLPYLAEHAIAYLAEYEQIILIGANPPIGFFAYPGVPSELQPETCDIIELASGYQDIAGAIAALLSGLPGVAPAPIKAAATLPVPTPSAPLEGGNACQIIANLIPDNAIVVEEGLTSVVSLFAMTQGSAPHDWMQLRGGAIGFGLPGAVGAAVAAPDRKVICAQADGSALYTIQALWTMAKENLDVCTIIFNNAKYNILELEFSRTGAPGGKPGPRAAEMFDLANPTTDFVKLAEGFGVTAVRCDTTESFEAALKDALAHKGPRLIEAIIPPFQINR